MIIIYISSIYWFVLVKVVFNLILFFINGMFLVKIIGIEIVIFFK